MSSRLELRGLDDLRQALRDLPDDLSGDAGAIVAEAARQAGAETQASYPRRTGNLQAGIRVTLETARGEVVGRLRSSSKHAHLFEYGTVPRQTRRGWNRGRMPVASEAERMIPKVLRARQRMQANLIGLLRSAGFEVRET